MKKALLILLLTAFYSCRLTNEDEFFLSEKKVDEDYWTSFSDRNEMLYQFSKMIAPIVNEYEVRKEILSYHSELTDGEVFVTFKDLLSARNNNRFSGSFLREIRDVRSLRQSGTISTDSLLLFLEENNYAIYAPYLAENWSETSLPITVSWWDGIDSTGVTPGIIEGVEGGRVSQLFSVDDDYAAANPTIVLVPADVDNCGNVPCGTNQQTNDTDTDIPYVPRSIDCRKLESDDKIRIDMPYFRLTGNLRPWPNRNILSLVTIVGEFSYDKDGIPQPKANTNFLWENKWVSRKSAREKRWMSSGISYIQSDWSQSEIELRIAVAYKKNKSKATFEGSVGIDEKKNFTVNLSAKYKFELGSKARLFDVGFDRCVFLADFSKDIGHGLKDDMTIYSFGSTPMQFVLRPEIK